MRRAAFLLTLTIVVVGGCGYHDDNPEAAAIVAKIYVDAHTARDAAAICRVLAPEIQLAIGAGRPCDIRLRTQLAQRYPRLTLGRVREVPSPPLNPRYAVVVREQPGREIVVARYGSTWLVVDGGRVQ